MVEHHIYKVVNVAQVGCVSAVSTFPLVQVLHAVTLKAKTPASGNKQPPKLIIGKLLHQLGFFGV